MRLMLLLLLGCPASGAANRDGNAEDSATNLSCDTIEGEALALRESWQGCSSGVECEVVDLYRVAGEQNCLMAFQCSGAFPVGADLTQLTADAAVLTDRAAACGECEIAGCDGEVQAVCNEATGLCELTSGG